MKEWPINRVSTKKESSRLPPFAQNLSSRGGRKNHRRRDGIEDRLLPQEESSPSSVRGGSLRFDRTGRGVEEGSKTDGSLIPPGACSAVGEDSAGISGRVGSSHNAAYESRFENQHLKAFRVKRIDAGRRRKRESSVDHIEMGIASPEQIRRWAERRLSTGSVTGRVENPDTVEYKTHRPIRDGLFCERIFGPVVDNSCACGRYKAARRPAGGEISGETLPSVCPKCEVELTSSSVRRVRLGFIQLFSGVTHIWYWRGRPSHITDLLGMKRRDWVENLVNCNTFLLESERAADATPLPKDSNPLPRGQPPSSRGEVFRRGVVAGSTPGESRRYNRSHTFPSSPLFTCPSLDRESFFGFLAESASREDRPLVDYCDVMRPPLQTSFSDLVTIHPMDREQAAQEVLCHTGGEAIRHLLEKVDLISLKRNLRHHLNHLEKILLLWPSKKRKSKGRKDLMRDRTLVIRRIKLVNSFIRTRRRPEWMVLSNLPVLPPDLRPIIRTPDGIIATSDLNGLYRRILFANKGLQKLSILDVNTICLAKRSLQDAVDALIENGKGGSRLIIDHNTGQPLKSLSASLKGKKGRFRHHLLGKRVDYSGRSVIVVGPTLHVHQCGLPREMAIELFHPFLIRHLQRGNFATTVAAAKRYISRHQPVMWKIVEQVINHHPVILNRAPTLHRLGIQAFQPRLVQGRAIHLHPLVCAGFNADFDGDQMGVHIPLSFQARAEAWRLLWSPNHILSPATGQPIMVPSQDMVLGCYYMTSFDGRIAFDGGADRRRYFANLGDALSAYAAGHVAVHTPLWVRFAGRFESHTNSEEPLEVRIHSNGRQLSIRSEVQRIVSTNGTQSRLVGRYIRTTAGRIVMHDVTVPME